MKNKMIALLVAIFWGYTANGQQAITTTGSDASGSGGSVASTVGQIAYTTKSGTNGSIAQGVQQPYEIWIVGVNDPSVDLKLTAYPNPATDMLTLRLSADKVSDFSFELSDINGKLIEKRKVNRPAEMIRMGYLPAAAYLLKVSNNNKEIKTFKIIKK